MHIMGVAAEAVQQQSQRLERSAGRLARLGRAPSEGESPPDIAKEAAVRIDAGALTKANLAVIKSEDERLGHLLDTLL